MLQHLWDNLHTLYTSNIKLATSGWPYVVRDLTGIMIYLILACLHIVPVLTELPNHGPIVNTNYGYVQGVTKIVSDG